MTGITGRDAVTREKQREKWYPVFNAFIHPGMILMYRAGGFRAGLMAFPQNRVKINTDLVYRDSITNAIPENDKFYLFKNKTSLLGRS